MRHITRPLQHLSLMLFLLGCFAGQPATAQWWQFGADVTEPEFTDLLFNQVSALRVERTLQFTADDIDNGKVIVRGRAEVRQGAIGRVEASLDDGLTWTEVPFSDRGLFAFEFRPEPERVYRFRIRALSTTGQASNETDHAFEFKVVRQDARALARAAFEELLARYMARDRAGFMALVSRDFSGNESALDSALSNDFRFFDSIRIRPTIQRVAAADDRWTIYFAFDRQVRSVRTGQLLQDRAYTTVTLIREGEGYKLHELAAPLIFGVSDPGDVATFVTDESVGTEVLTVDRDGNVSTQEQGRTTQAEVVEEDRGPPSNISEGSVTLANNQGYSLITRTKVAPINAPGPSFTFGAEGYGATPMVFSVGDVIGAQKLTGFASLTAVTSVPEVLAEPSLSGDVWSVGDIYALQLLDGTYAIVRLASGGGSPWSFQYRHQRNGTASFR